MQLAEDRNALLEFVPSMASLSIKSGQPPVANLFAKLGFDLNMASISRSDCRSSFGPTVNGFPLIVPSENDAEV